MCTFPYLRWAGLIFAWLTVSVASIAATLRLPELSAVSRSTASISAPGNLTYSFSLNAGTSAAKSVTFMFRTPSGAARSLSTTTPASGQLTVALGADWQNGSYDLASITVTDVWNRYCVYAADGSVTADDGRSPSYIPLIAATPSRHAFNFAALGFSVSGGVAAPSAPRLTALALVTGGTLVPGGIARYSYSLSPGSSSVARLQATITYGVNPSFSRTVTVDAPSANGTIEFEVTSDLINGAVSFDELRLTDAQSRTTTYSRRSSQVRDIGYTDAAQTAPSSISFATLGFTVSGAATYYAYYSFKSSATPATVSPGSVVHITYAATSGTTAVRGCTFVITGPLGVSLSITTNSTAGAVDVPIAADWINGSYKVTNAIVLDGYGTSIGTLRNSENAAFTVVGALAVAPIITRQPVSAQTIISGRTAMLDVLTEGAGPITYQWYRGRRGDVSAPVSGGTSNLLEIPITEDGTYWVRVTSDGLSVDSNEAVVTVIKTPVITQSPSNQSAPVGGSATFSVTAISAEPPTYRWRTMYRQFTGEEFNRPTITLTNLTAADAGVIRCIVSNRAGETYSDWAILNVRVSDAPLTITLNPQDAVSMAGTGPSVTFSAEATGNPPLLYQWQKDGIDLPSATSATFRISTSAMSASAPGAYRMKVTNGAETVYSRAATLSFATSPVIVGILGGGNPNGLVGDYVSLYPNVLGVGPFTYQWRKNGQPIVGATAERLTLGPLTLADVGNYDVIVSNALGSATSPSAALTVSQPTTAPEIVRNPSSQTVVAGQTVTFTVEATGSNLQYLWRRDNFTIPGATQATLTILSASASDAGKYDVLVTNSAGTRSSQLATLTVTPRTTAPVITQPPQAKTVRAGETLTLTCAADGEAPLTFLWLFNGNPIASSGSVVGQNGATLRIFGFGAANAGSYSVRVANGAGTVTSVPAQVSLAAPADDARIVNLSVRAGLSPQAKPLIVGFVVGGAGTTGSVPLLVRGMGPSLEKYGVTDALPNPQLLIYEGGGVFLDSNDDWGGNGQVAAAATQVGAFPFGSERSGDAALVQTCVARAYSVHVVESQNRSGTALAELYDTTTAENRTALTPRLINVSARMLVQPGVPLIVGFVVRGAGSRSVLIRGVGPGLSNYGVNGPLAEPHLTLYDAKSVRIAENNAWAGTAELTSAFAQVGAFELAKASKDTALLVSLAAGNYTAQVSASDNASGSVLIEVYEVPAKP